MNLISLIFICLNGLWTMLSGYVMLKLAYDVSTTLLSLSFLVSGLLGNIFYILREGK